MKRISILGSTGSIGKQTLEVIEHHSEAFRVEALAAGTNGEELLKQIMKFKPKLVSVANKELAERLSNQVPADTKVLYGKEGLMEVATVADADYVMSALVGSIGLEPTLAAIQAGKQIGLANKETLITAGHIVTSLAKEHGVAIIPVDSEHSAIFQSLNGESKADIKKITLTASGGSFRDKTRSELRHVTVEQALQHPNWSMGAKITIDSATMVNKGLEVMEAHWLFGVDYDQIDVLIHPESIVHSFVEYRDSSVIAQLGWPDMRVPIQYALSYPERLPGPVDSLNLAQVGKLHFAEIDLERFRCLKLAYDCGRQGGTAPTVFNAANEVAVARFLAGDIEFLDIETILEKVLEMHEVTSLPSLEHILEVDRWARDAAKLV